MSDSDVELPPDVKTPSEEALPDVDLPDDVQSSDVELPPDAASDGPCEDEGTVRQRCACKLKCFTKFPEQEVRFFRETQLADPNRMKHAFTKVKAFVEGLPNSKAKIAWAIADTKVCRPFWEHYYAIGHKQVDDLVAYAKAGHPQIPERGARLPKEKPKADAVDVWFLGIYQGSAEPTPMESSGDKIQELDVDVPQHEVVNDVHHPLYGLSVAVDKGVEGKKPRHLVPQRFLNETNLASLWHLYKTDEKVSEKVSRDTFTKAFNKSWKSVLKFKNAGQGTRCSLCAEMDEERKQCTTLQERQELDLRKQKHFQRHDADRSVNVRGNQLSSDPATFLSQNASLRVVKFMVDGMDQAKFRTPRNLSASSVFCQAVRPALHLTGAIAFGVLEAYFIMGPDTKKDANMNCTCISKTLDLCKSALAKMGPEYGLPRHAIIAADNTPREAKNQFFATFAASLVSQHHFDTLEVQFLQAGHTKNEIDQRFSTIATALSRAPVLETPTDFANWILQHVRPLHGKELHVFVLDETWDFQKMYQDYNVQISGLTATHLQPNANHLWRFECRQTLEPSLAVAVHNPNWKDVPPHDADVILSVKQCPVSI